MGSNTHITQTKAMGYRIRFVEKDGVIEARFCLFERFKWWLTRSIMPKTACLHLPLALGYEQGGDVVEIIIEHTGSSMQIHRKDIPRLIAALTSFDPDAIESGSPSFDPALSTCESYRHVEQSSELPRRTGHNRQQPEKYSHRR